MPFLEDNLKNINQALENVHEVWTRNSILRNLLCMYNGGNCNILSNKDIGDYQMVLPETMKYYRVI